MPLCASVQFSTKAAEGGWGSGRSSCWPGCAIEVHLSEMFQPAWWGQVDWVGGCYYIFMCVVSPVYDVISLWQGHMTRVCSCRAMVTRGCGHLPRGRCSGCWHVWRRGGPCCQHAHTIAAIAYNTPSVSLISLDRGVHRRSVPLLSAASIPDRRSRPCCSRRLSTLRGAGQTWAGRGHTYVLHAGTKCLNHTHASSLSKSDPSG